MFLTYCRPFDVNNYEDEIDEDDILDEEGQSRLKLKVSNYNVNRYNVSSYSVNSCNRNHS